MSIIERIAIEKSGFEALYTPHEKIKTIVVDNFPELGKLTALRFIEWVLANPEGVISLPTGKTPEYFFKWVDFYLKNWYDKKTKLELESLGLDTFSKPTFKDLKFVQIDEFYPINSGHHNSFYHYVNHYYIDGFGINPENALLIKVDDIGLEKGDTLESVWDNYNVDLGLRHKHPQGHKEEKQKKVLEKIDFWCQNYEEKIRELGGIGFFLGGTGPDGHIGFNVRGSNHFSTTRLTATNYETQAAAAADLGGIEISRKSHVITIGLGTITYKSDCTAIIMAAGEAKAGIVANAIQSSPHPKVPATSLHKLRNAALYITKGASKLLDQRSYVSARRNDKISDSKAEEILINISIAENIQIDELTKKDLEKYKLGKLLLEKCDIELFELTKKVYTGLENKIQRGMTTQLGKKFLHTEPHHDDLMLGYLPYIVRHIRSSENTHNFATLTSGFTAVTNDHILEILENSREYIKTEEYIEYEKGGYFNPEEKLRRNRDVWRYLDGVAEKSAEFMIAGECRRMIRNLREIHKISTTNETLMKIRDLINYLNSQYSGQKDREEVQRLKGMCREWEAECLWGYFGWDCSNISHLRLGFYKGDLFNEEPTIDRDMEPILELLRNTSPDVVSVALDPEASGPDTHYKVLQAITGALKIYEEETGKKDIKILGYRNVWYRFHPSSADIIVPVSLNMFSIMHSSFISTFASQRKASFPSHEHDGPFSELAQKIQVEQYRKLEVCLGKKWFHEHLSPLIKATRGVVYLKEMTLEELYSYSREVKMYK